MKILLVSTYELGHQPIGLASPAAQLLQRGHDVRCLDLAVEPFDCVRAADVELVGISVPMHTALRLGVHAAGRVRALNPTCHMCFYGLYASLNGEYLLGHAADSVIGAEFEPPLLALADRLSGGAPTGTAGVWTKDHFSEPFLGRQQFLKPARNLLPPLKRYAQLINNGAQHLVGAVEASRGCAHTCLHCPITPVYGGRLRIVPQDVVLADARALVDMGAEHITFGDPDFFNGIKHSMAIVRQLHDDFPKVTFDATIKIEHIVEKRELMPELKRLGCLFVVSAVESLSDRVLLCLDKGHTRAQIDEALGIVRQAGLWLKPSLIPFTPWSTMTDYLELLDWAEQEALVESIDPVHFAIRLLLPPGSSLLSKPYTIPHLLGLNQADFSYEWRHPDERMDRLHEEVAALVESAVHARTDRCLTFARIKEVARAAAGAPPVAPLAARQTQGVKPPYLTESWFC